MANGGNRQQGGFRAVRGAADDYGGDLLEPVAMLAAGASKASVAWTAFKNVWTTKVLGPVGMLTGVTAGAMVGIAKMSRAFAEMGMSGAANLEKLTTAFKPLLKGIESAKARMAELAKFASATPFRMDQVTQASKTLEVLTRGALSTTKGLKLVGDAAAVTGREFNEMAVWVGRLYDGLMSGRPIGEVAQQLQAVGVISGATRNQIEALLEQGKAGNEVWQIAEKEIRRAEGAMQDMSKTLEGLQGTLADNKSLMEAAFSKGFLDGEKAGVEALAQAYEKLTPTMESLGGTLGAVSNGWEKLKAMMVSGAASILGAVLPVGGAIATALGGGVLAASIGKLGQFLGQTIKGAGASKQAAAGFAQMGTAALRLWAALKNLATGNTAAAKASLSGAGAIAAQGAAAVRTAGLMGGLGGAMRAVGGLAMWLGRSIATAFSAALLNWPVMLAAGLVAAGLAWQNYKAKQEAAAEAVRAFNTETKEQVALLAEQAAAIKTAADLGRYQARTLKEQADAYAALSAAKDKLAANPGDKNAAAQVAAAQTRLDEKTRLARGAQTIDPAKLAPSGGQETTADKLARAQAAADTSFDAALERASPEERARMLSDRAARRGKAGQSALDQESRNQAGALASGARSARSGAVQSLIDERLESLRGMEANMPAAFNSGIAGQGMGVVANPAFAATQQRIRETREEIAALRAEQAQLDGAPPFIAETEMEKMEEMIRLIDTYTQAMVDASQAVPELKPDASDEERQGAAVKRMGVRAAQASLGSLRGQLGISGMSDEAAAAMLSGTRADLQGRMEFARGQGRGFRDSAAGDQAAADAAERDVAERDEDAALDERKAAISLMTDEIDKAAALLQLERDRLAVEMQRGGLSAGQVAAREAELAAQEDLVKKEQDRTAKEAALDLRMQETEALDEGAEKLDKQMEIERERAELIEDPTRRQEALDLIDEEEKQAKQQLSRRQQAAALDQQDATNATRYRGAERDLKEIETARARVGLDKSTTAEEKAAQQAQLTAREAEITRASNRAAAQGMLGFSVSRSQTREDELERTGKSGSALRERQRRQADERKLARMDLEDQSEDIADPAKRKQFIEEGMQAWEEAADADIDASRKRQQKADAAYEAYEKWAEAERQRIISMMRVQEQMALAQAGLTRWKLDNADALEKAGLLPKGQEDALLAEAQGLEENAAQKEDAIKMDELIRQYLEEGRSMDEAQALAQQQVDGDRAERGAEYRQEKLDQKLSELEELQGMSNAATAVSSMRSLGGGGGAYGPEVGDRLKEIKGLLAEIKGLLAEPVPLLEQQEAVKPYSS